MFGNTAFLIRSTTGTVNSSSFNVVMVISDSEFDSSCFSQRTVQASTRSWGLNSAHFDPSEEYWNLTDLRQFEITDCMDQDCELTSLAHLTASWAFFMRSSRSKKWLERIETARSSVRQRDDSKMVRWSNRVLHAGEQWTVPCSSSIYPHEL